MGKYISINFKMFLLFKINAFVACFSTIVESHPKFSITFLIFYKFDKIVQLSTCVFAHKIFNKSSSIPSLFHDSLREVSNLHKYNTRYTSKSNFYRPNVRTNTGKSTFVYVASKLRETVPTNLTSRRIPGPLRSTKHFPSG